MTGELRTPLLATALLISITGCRTTVEPDHGGGDHVADGGSPDGSALSPDGSYFLARVGSAEVSAHPGDTVTLRVLASNPVGMPGPDGGLAPERLPGVAVSFGDRNDAGFSASETTGSDGTVSTQLAIGSAFRGALRIHAGADGFRSHADWTVQVSPFVKHLRIIPQPPLIALTDTATATTAAISTTVAGHVDLRVQVYGDEGVPVANEPVTFQFITSIAGAGFDTADTDIPTDMSGMAQVGLSTGTTIGAYKVKATIAGNISATFNVTVATSAAHCRTDIQCGSGYYCSSGSCVSGDPACPLGFEWSSTDNTCVALTFTSCSANSCPSGFSCGGNNECVANTPQCSGSNDCPAGATCSHGLCFQGAPTSFDATGHWYTTHIFDVHSVLPAWMQLTAEMITALDDIQLGQIPGLPPVIGTFLGDLVKAYVPQWALDVLALVDNLYTMFSRLEVHGEMVLVATGENTFLSGSEDWDHFAFFDLARCHGNFGTVQPGIPPACAEVDVYTADLAQANFATTVHPFQARLVGDRILIDPRTVGLQLAGIIEYTINQIVSSTGHPSLQGPPGHPELGALYNLIDCPGVAALVQDSGIPTDVTSDCEALVHSAADDLAQQLSNIVINGNALSFSGSATAQISGNVRVTQLGRADFQTNAPADGTWTGNLNSIGSVTGRWTATRQP